MRFGALRWGVVLAGAILLASCGLSAVGALAGDPVRTDDEAGIDAASDGTDAPSQGSDDAGDAEPASDATTDGAPTDAAVKQITLAQTVSKQVSSNTTITATLQPTKAGSLVATMITMFQSASATVASVTDNATGGSNVYTSADARSILASCQSSEIWYARSAKAGATSLTVTISTTASIQLWVLELPGADAIGAVDTRAMDSGSATTVIDAPKVTPTNVPAIVLNVTGSCGTISALRAGSGFQSLPIQAGNAAAYLIAVDAGTFGPSWNNSSNAWNGSTAAFR